MEQLKYKVVQGDDNNNKGPVVRSFFSSSSSESGISSGSSLDSDSFEEVTSPASSSSSAADQPATEPLSDMSSLFQQLPIKRGLSKYYEGKAQSFTSIAKVNSLEDLVKPENPYNKKLKTCSSYGGVMGETSQRGSCSSLSANRGTENFMDRRPPIPPHRSTTTSSIPNQTALFV
ncbi:hypothetical protein AAZX31_02G224800 [Glycine max]|uniref:Oxidative stress 3 n=2 Tax=Glycine subgen. Soja TaxID=1462606 RepID=I1JHR1_SOYBN|nr:uncharacterized protein LOC100782016 [Glycine max]XP_028215584.1 uncharacterized protein LOC114397638 [Glycine soja]KAG5052883.1 hypothetical protein JHK87_005081 [Glycine soja]KAG5064230.1 hypothetical protein JHK85_005413 [Glycine max]KAG5081183.1 hypothetical protein JHK86_005248 [Glycine max]KAH1061830.1 hypothetical protein GYH30_005035 [Glycine max]KAH1263105.1 hypothetical protein GmHk_02G005581 [Glycine max]|eukprot:XP_014624948.1 uncharacterized protein LOC100782016 [Glycine max]